MKLTYASLRNFKRFSNAHIKEIEMEFQAPVQIIVGSNGCGKSSMLRELSPLPSTRTDYDQNGMIKMVEKNYTSNKMDICSNSSPILPTVLVLIVL